MLLYKSLAVTQELKALLVSVKSNEPEGNHDTLTMLTISNHFSVTKSIYPIPGSEEAKHKQMDRHLYVQIFQSNILLINIKSYGTVSAWLVCTVTVPGSLLQVFSIEVVLRCYVSANGSCLHHLHPINLHHGHLLKQQVSILGR